VWPLAKLSQAAEVARVNLEAALEVPGKKAGA